MTGTLGKNSYITTTQGKLKRTIQTQQQKE